MHFDHQKLDAYRAAVDFVVLTDEIVEQIPRGRQYLADQLKRAGTSIPLNIAEGAGEFSGREKARFYRMARRSATECAAILDVCFRLELGERGRLERGARTLVRIVAMLTRMIQRVT
ncbi:MAG: four helix bundle protein [bacterium]|nr:four helix bundle protein [bacterium]